MNRPQLPWHAYFVLYRPKRILHRLRQLVDGGVIGRVPTIWQIELGVLRMWHRVLFRPETIGTCAEHAVRATWRARLLRFRAFRGPFLVWERAIAPFDHSGLCSPTWRIARHLLAAHHDERQFAYDLEMLRATPEVLEDIRARALEVIEERTPRARWLRDLVVFDRYHENLVASVDDALAGRPLVAPHEANNPDIGFSAYIRWCLAQPETARATWRAWRQGEFPKPINPGVHEPTEVAA